VIKFITVRMDEEEKRLAKVPAIRANEEEAERHSARPPLPRRVEAPERHRRLRTVPKPRHRPARNAFGTIWGFQRLGLAPVSGGGPENEYG